MSGAKNRLDLKGAGPTLGRRRGITFRAFPQKQKEERRSPVRIYQVLLVDILSTLSFVTIESGFTETGSKKMEKPEGQKVTKNPR